MILFFEKDLLDFFFRQGCPLSREALFVLSVAVLSLHCSIKGCDYTGKPTNI